MKNRFWIIIFCSVAAICMLICVFISEFLYSSDIVGIYQNGILVRKIDLNTVTTEYEISLSGEAGENIVLVSQGHIRMKSAECPDKVCVNHGELKKSNSPIVCLPNKIIIKYEEPKKMSDAITGAE